MNPPVRKIPRISSEGWTTLSLEKRWRAHLSGSIEKTLLGHKINTPPSATNYMKEAIVELTSGL
jgi:hypothetical protein